MVKTLKFVRGLLGSVLVIMGILLAAVPAVISVALFVSVLIVLGAICTVATLVGIALGLVFFVPGALSYDAESRNAFLSSL